MIGKRSFGKIREWYKPLEDYEFRESRSGLTLKNVGLVYVRYHKAPSCLYACKE